MGNKLNHKRILLFLIPVLTISMVVAITNGLFAQQGVEFPNDYTKGDNNALIAPKSATSGSTLHYYTNLTAWTHLFVSYDSPSDYQYLSVQYNIGATSILTGINYEHQETSGVGPFDLNINFTGDTGSAFYTTSVPTSATGEWRSFRCLGPTYVIDDDPVVNLTSSDPVSDSISIGADLPTTGQSWYDKNGNGWTPSASYEYMVELVYESIPTLVKDVSQNGIIGSSDYVDAYYVTLTTGITSRFTLTRSSGTGNLNMRLVSFVTGGTTGSTIISTSGSTYPEQMQYTPLTNGIYMLLVEPASPADAAQYSITLTCSDDSYEENDMLGNARSMATGTFLSLVCADEDWYKLYVHSVDTITAYLNFSNAIGDLDLGIYNATGTTMASSTSTNDWELAVYEVTVPGYYYVRVIGYSGAMNKYNMTLSVAGDDIYEDNEPQGNATTLTSEGTYSGLVCADDDWFRIYINAGNNLTANISLINSLGNLDLVLYSQTLLQLSTSTSTNDWERVTYEIITDGYYYLKIFRASGLGKNNYNMTLAITASSGDDSYEQNEQIEQAKLVTSGSYSSLVCLDPDWYMISIPQFSRITVTITFPDAGGDLSLVVYDGSGSTAGIGEISGGTNKVSVDVVTGGTYYIQIFEAGVTNTYTMDIEITSTGGIAGFNLFLLLGASSLAIYLMLQKKLKFAR